MIREVEQPPDAAAMDGWLKRHLWHHSAFADYSALVERKQALGTTIGVCIPTLNEAATIGEIVGTLRASLMEDVPLLDELMVMDSGSTDSTRQIAKDAGARVVEAAAVLPGLPRMRGKGENLWKALQAMRSDLLCHVDGDIANMHPRFVTGLVGPLLTHPELMYVKAFYRRPLADAGAVLPSEGGRVTEILVRPMFAAFFPELSGFIQPLSGEYAARRSVLERIAYPVGYGVETAHLIDIWRGWGLGALGQVDLDQRVHRHQSTLALGRMAYGILQCLLRRVQNAGRKVDFGEISPWLRQFEPNDAGNHQLRVHQLAEMERPPMIEIPDYHAAGGDVTGGMEIL